MVPELCTEPDAVELEAVACTGELRDALVRVVAVVDDGSAAENECVSFAGGEEALTDPIAVALDVSLPRAGTGGVSRRLCVGDMPPNGVLLLSLVAAASGALS